VDAERRAIYVFVSREAPEILLIDKNRVMYVEKRSARRAAGGFHTRSMTSIFEKA
jgi:hypothetical protein